VHVKRDYNQPADYLTSKTHALGESWVLQDDDEKVHLETVSKIHEQLIKPPVVIKEDIGEGAQEKPGDILNDDPVNQCPVQSQLHRHQQRK
jgi:hypothetical protein